MRITFALFGILLVLAVLTICGGVAAIIAVSIVRKRRNGKAAEIAVDAVVLEKHQTTQRHPIAGDPTGAHGYTTFVFCKAVFQTADGTQIPLDADREAYDTLTEGERGRLIYQSTRLIAFQPNR